MFFPKSINLLFSYRSEYLDIFCCILITYIQPELVELVWRCIFGVKPYITRLSFAKFTTISFSNQRASKCKSLATYSTTDKFSSGSYVTPLVRATHLKLTSLCLV